MASHFIEPAVVALRGRFAFFTRFSWLLCKILSGENFLMTESITSLSHKTWEYLTELLNKAYTDSRPAASFMRAEFMTHRDRIAALEKLVRAYSVGA